MAKTKQTIIINGRHYDAATGAALEKSPPKAAHLALSTAPKPIKKPTVISDISPPASYSARPKVLVKARRPAPNLKNQLQHSTTLRRDALKKPISPRRPSAHKIHKKVERSHRISRFAPIETSPPKVSPAPAPDPELARQAEQLRQAHAEQIQKQAAAKAKPAISSRLVKEHLLQQQLAKAPLAENEIYQAGRMSPKARFMSVASTSLALVLLGGYLTYINLPNLSIRVAAANAGIDASLPKYQPGGYRLRGPVAYSEGQVSLAYQQNGGQQGYRVIQKASDWDPQATLDNYVKPQSHDNYQIHSSQGLTVYTYDNKAVWVNGGILHVIDATAPLSGQQVEQIAVSM